MCLILGYTDRVITGLTHESALFQPSINMIDHYTLVERVRGGEIEAFGLLVERFQNMAVGTAFTVLGDFHLAEDAAQEAFTHAYLNLTQLRDPGAFPGWFRRIVLKYCDRHTRKWDRMSAMLDGEHVLHVESSEGPEASLEKAESQTMLWDAIWDLSDEDRELVVLFYISDVPQATIAQFLGVSVDAVKNSCVRRGRARVKGC